MYVLEAVIPLETDNPFATTILGMPVVTFGVLLFITLVVLSALGFFWWNANRLAKHKNDSRGKIIAEFLPEHGGRVYRVLCEVYKMEVKQVQSQSRAYFMASGFIKAPPSHAIDGYYALPEHDYLDQWPENAKPMQQVTLQKFYFVENDPCPRLPHDPSRWDADRYTRVTSAIAKLAKDESNLQVLVSEMSGVWQNIADFVQKLKMIPILMYMIGGLALINLFTAFMVFQSNQGIQQLVKFLVGAPAK
jgi:hypothetical protein